MNPALDYAENFLGVHRVQEEADALLTQLNDAMNALDAAIDARRNLDEKIEDHQMDVMIALRGTLGGEISQAAFDKRLKETYHKDETLKRLRMERNAKAGEASGLELDVKYIEAQLRVKVARMEELGGYFNYLAAVKNAAPPPVQYAEAGAPPEVQAPGGEASQSNETGDQQ